ncbi:hypothetical protein [Pseudonocardia nigra]|nr:hypothetical protein [Pseudonocardia nigra]
MPIDTDQPVPGSAESDVAGQCGDSVVDGPDAGDAVLEELRAERDES